MHSTPSIIKTAKTDRYKDKRVEVQADRKRMERERKDHRDAARTRKSLGI